MAGVKPSLFKSFGHTPVKAWMIARDNGTLRWTVWKERKYAKSHIESLEAVTGSHYGTPVRVVILRESDYRNLVVPKRRAKKGTRK